MAELKLVIGNKNYSSWSMRPWLALRANNIPFEEIFIPLYTGAADKQRILMFRRRARCRPGRWRPHGLGFARHHRISRRKVSGEEAMAGRPRRAARMRGRFRRRCIRGSRRCATNAA